MASAGLILPPAGLFRPEPAELPPPTWKVEDFIKYCRKESLLSTRISISIVILILIEELTSWSILIKIGTSRMAGILNCGMPI